jgi:hypothetical protein
MKLTALAAALALAAAPLMAQGPALGIELGYSRASFSGRDAGGVKLHEGAVAGAYISANLSSWLAFRPGLLLSTKGGATNVVADSAGNSVRLDLELVYIDIPVILRARFPMIGQSRIVVSGGLLPGIRIGCATDVISENETPLNRTPCRAGALRPFDVEALAGIGLGIPIERSFLALEVRLTQGMVSIVNDGDLKNRALTIMLTVPF